MDKTAKELSIFEKEVENLGTKEYFPLFISSKNKRVLVIGGGTVAQRRIETLLKFEFSINVIAITATPSLENLAKTEKIKLTKRAFIESDIDDGYSFILAATDDLEANGRVVFAAREKKVPVNVASCKEDCDFFFPGVVTTSDAVIGVTCEGKSHFKAKFITDKIKDLFK